MTVAADVRRHSVARPSHVGRAMPVIPPAVAGAIPTSSEATTPTVFYGWHAAPWSVASLGCPAGHRSPYHHTFGQPPRTHSGNTVRPGVELPVRTKEEEPCVTTG
jgi:hypothetical protein